MLVCTQGFPRSADDHRAPFILDHARALAAAGAHVTVLCPSAPGLPGRERFGDVDVVRFRYAPRRFETLAYGGAMHHRARGPAALLLPTFLLGFLVAATRHARAADVLHAHWWAPSGLVAVIAARLVGVGAVVHVHGTDAAIARGPLRWLARRVLRAADAVLAASGALSAWVRDTAGVDAVVAPMPLGLDRVPAPTPPPPDGPVLAVGRLVPEKGFDVLVRAVARAGLPLVVVGDGDERVALEGLAVDVGADVTFVGSVPPAALAGHYAAARLVAVPSRREGFGLVAAEAAAAGRAVVASRVGGLPDVVRDGVTGALVAPDDVDALVAALRTTDPALGAQGPDAVRWLRPEAAGERDVAVERRAAEQGASRRALLPVAVRWGGGTLALLAVGLAVRAVVDQWDRADDLSVSWEPGPVAVAVGAVLAANLGLSWIWGWLVRHLGGALPWRAAMRVWWTGQLGRYLPTGLGSLPARVVVGARAGVGRGVLLLATGAEMAAVVVVTATTAALLLPGPAGPAVGVVGLAAGVAAFTPLLGVVGQRLHPEGAVPRPLAAGFLGGQQAIFLARCAGFWALLHVVSPTAPSLARTAGALGLSVFVGTVAVFSPGGVGVREAVLVGLLSSSIGPPAATAAAVTWRLLELAVELPVLAWSRTLYAPAP